MAFPFLPAINGIEVETDNVQRYSNALCSGNALDVFLNAFNIFEASFAKVQQRENRREYGTHNIFDNTFVTKVFYADWH